MQKQDLLQVPGMKLVVGEKHYGLGRSFPRDFLFPFDSITWGIKRKQVRTKSSSLADNYADKHNNYKDFPLNPTHSFDPMNVIRVGWRNWRRTVAEPA